MLFEKTEKDKLNTKERRSRQRLGEKEALLSRANSLKRAVSNIVKHSERIKPRHFRRLSTQADSLKSEHEILLEWIDVILHICVTVGKK